MGTWTTTEGEQRSTPLEHRSAWGNGTRRYWYDSCSNTAESRHVTRSSHIEAWVTTHGVVPGAMTRTIPESSGSCTNRVLRTFLLLQSEYFLEAMIADGGIPFLNQVQNSFPVRCSPLPGP